MKRQLAYVSAVAMPLLFMVGCSTVWDVRGSQIVGSGRVISEFRRVSGIDAVELSGVGHLIIEHGAREGLTITAEHNILPYLISEVRGGRLILGTTPHTSLAPQREIQYRLTVRWLDEIAVSGAGQVEAYDIDNAFLRVAISGAAAVAAYGIADEQWVSLSGAGYYDGRGLATRITQADLSGAAHALVRVRDELHASVSGSGVVEYIGRPLVRGSVSGSGVIIPLDR